MIVGAFRVAALRTGGALPVCDFGDNAALSASKGSPLDADCGLDDACELDIADGTEDKEGVRRSDDLGFFVLALMSMRI